MNSLSKNKKIDVDIDTMVSIIEPHNSNNDLILTKTKSLVFQEIVNLIEQKNFLARENSMSQGLVVLFSGHAGTGKTMSAEYLAYLLGLSIYRIDLSQVVSEYISETEKNLKKIFDAAEDAGAILLFDEADILFGKRSQVKDSHDKYSNVEVNYLLQRIEAYWGLVVLSTNKTRNLQKQHIPNLGFIVDFPHDLKKLR
jgi:SpoVK/Ycf46/Vps4 family AAA+-type ATPase